MSYEYVFRFGAFLIFAAVTWLSLAPNPLPSGPPPIPAFLGHILMHLALAITVLLGWPLRVKLALWGLAGIAVGMEVIQFWVPRRVLDPVDLACNLLGLLLGYLFVRSVWRFVR